MLEKFDYNLQKLAHYQNFPEMLPFIGDNYEKTRLLIVGESHYLPTGSTIQQNPEEWYKSNNEQLTEKEKGWINTRAVLKDFFISPTYKPFRIFYSIAQAIQEKSLELKNSDVSEIFNNFSMYNFFQRPAESEGESINNTSLDIEKAENTLHHVIQSILPKFIIFVSVKAWESFNTKTFIDLYNIKFDYCPYPATAYWNTTVEKYGNMTGKQKFIKFLEDNGIFG